ncbi:MAG: bifunctional homocysteine S-methyltransferase/methylenetetrahydrofolate reductase [Planctomycetota bacterium]|nr:bifunctional homocysteine S-methyltransferase/methylenetetrahydrofolate reductase [Planctomycetota bacterium]
MNKPRTDLRELLKERVLVLDGGMGTSLNERGVAFTDCFELAVLERPQLVREVHRAFLDAGADAIQTNTFGASRIRLARHHLEHRQEEIFETAAKIAREAAGEHRHVLGALGPLGVEMEPIGRLAREEVRAAYREAAARLAPLVDGIVLETFNHVEELVEAVRGVREASDAPLFAFLSVNSRGYTTHGTSGEQGAILVAAAGPDLIGFNCSTGPRAVLEAALTALTVIDLPIGAKPNAGMPREVDGRVFYQNDPDYFARFARRFLQAGGRLVGGCCGTTPEHVRALARAARMGNAQDASVAPIGSARAPRLHERARAPLQAIPLAERSAFGAALAAGDYPVSIELLPPRTPDMSAMIESARALKAAGAHAVNLPDGPRASARISNIAAAAILQRETGLDALVHFCCRDRNLLGMQSDLLGAAALGVHDLLVVTGDPPYQGNYPEVTAVFDVDAIGLCNIVDQLNHGLDLGGNPLGAQTGFCYGAAWNHAALDAHREYERFNWKQRAGVDFFITQPVFDADEFLRALEQLPTERPPILAGVWPLRSLRNAEFLHSEVPGVHLPIAVLERMERADAKGRAAEEGIALARAVIEALASSVQGFQIAAPFNKIEAALPLLQAVIAGR